MKRKKHTVNTRQRRGERPLLLLKTYLGYIIKDKSSCVCRSCRPCSRRSEIAQLIHDSHGRLGLSSVAASSHRLNSAYTGIAAS